MSSKKNARKHDGRHLPAKKYSKHDANLQKNNGFTFAIAMVLTLLAVYVVIEVEVPKQEVAIVDPEIITDDPVYVMPDVIKIYEEEVAKEQKQQVKKVQQIIDEIIIDDKKNIVQSSNLVTDAPVTDVFIDPNNVIVDSGPGEDITIPATMVEQVPMFEDCLDVPKSEQRECFEEGMKNHVRKTFRYPEPAVDLGQSGKVYTTFTIDKNGNIKDVRLRGPYKILEKEAARIISKLPKMIPGKQGIHDVNVTFSMPITFKLQ